jgi:hypothetical protein
MSSTDVSSHTLLESQRLIPVSPQITCFLVVLLLFYIIFVALIKIFAHFKLETFLMVNNGNKRAIMDKSSGPF